MIENEEGKHFDPAIVDAFRARYEDFLEVLSGRAGEVAEESPLEMAGV